MLPGHHQTIPSWFLPADGSALPARFLCPTRHFREGDIQLSRKAPPAACRAAKGREGPGRARKGQEGLYKDCMMCAVKVISPYLTKGGTDTASPLRLL